MRKCLVCVIALLALAFTSLGSAASSPSRADTGRSVASRVALTASGQCSKATAQRLVMDRVAGVLCGAFLGPGSRAMVVSLTTGVCLPFVGWELYVRKAGGWQHVPLPPHGGLSGHAPKAVGNGIQETLDVRRPGDTPCNPTGGMKTRIWHWNGSRLVAGPWKATQDETLHLAQFRSPSGNLACEFGFEVSCVSVKAARYAALTPNGRVFICQTYGGPCLFSTKIFKNGGKLAAAPVLGYGQQNELSGFRCASETKGITCTVIRSGKGFLINRNGVSRVGS